MIGMSQSYEYIMHILWFQQEAGEEKKDDAKSKKKKKKKETAEAPPTPKVRRVISLLNFSFLSCSWQSA